jgi:hypothetical protein
MDQFTFVPSSAIGHPIEAYTSRFVVNGIVSGAYRRTSDLLNRKDDNFLQVTEPTITSVAGTDTDAQKLNTTLWLARRGIHFVSLPLPAQGGEDAGSQEEGAAQPPQPRSLPREFHITKRVLSCLVMTDTFIIRGQCHLLEGTTLEQLLQVGDAFIPITHTTIFLAARVSHSWQRDLVIVNKEKIEAMYGDESSR